ncbi:MAG: M48 family metallopeptidase [Ectothiorhodospiraceae bacterium]|nr:M48 family metallopeptidase [Chromatiales bacterium]MCP5156309.1 M48 family metallopeptidase [Ectothiorhodospiraceae bacterium]
MSACLLGGGAAAQVRLPDIGDASGGALSLADERRLGEAFMREVRAQLTVVDDPEVESYAQGLGSRLSATAETTGGFTVFVVASDAINAFAGPGGFIGMHSGLILGTESESELASVLAHEMAHVTQRHIARAFEMADRTSLSALAGLLAALVIGTQNSQAGQAAVAAVSGVQAQRALDFSRANEQEADRVGMQLLAEAGFDPRSMPTFFERLQNAVRYYRRPPEYLSTHPVTTSRIADSRSRAEQFPYRQHADSLGYALVKARLRVLTTRDPKEALAWFEDALQSERYRSLEATAYGWALALARLGRHTQAVEVLEKLVDDHPDRVQFRAALGDTLLRAGQDARAVTVYREAQSLFPDDATVIRGYGRALIASGESPAALRLIDDHARLHGMDAALHKLAAEAYQRTGQTARGQLALAEHYYQTGQAELAIHQLRMASRDRDADYFVTAQATARLRELEQEQEERTRR